MEKREEERKKKELEAIKEAIKSKKLRWKAGKTKISGMDEKERNNLLGTLIEKDELERILKKQEEKEKKRIGRPRESGSVDPPPDWDWRNVSGEDWTTPIKDQSVCGSCGSCVAFGVIGALDMLVKRWVYNDPEVIPDFSEAHLYFCNNRRCTAAEGNYGWWINEALDYLKENGVPDECCFPYAAAPTQQCGTCEDWEDRIDHTKIKDWKTVTDITEMKKLLSEHGCLVGRMTVYEDFFYYVGGVYEHSWGEYRGGHAITVVGYDDVDECWICKNSWGPCWGEPQLGKPLPNPAGWFRIAYGECGIDDKMYKIELVCPAEESAVTMGFKKEEIQMVRGFRDRLLTTRKGRAYLARASRDLGAVTRVLHILQVDEKIRGEAMKALKPFIAAVRTMDEKEPLKLEEEHFKAANIVLDRIVKADPNLKLHVNRIKQEIPLHVRKNLRQIMSEL